MTNSSDSNIKVNKVFHFDDDIRIKINHFARSYNGTPFHEVEFNIIVSNVYNTKFYYLIAEEEGEIVGVCPIHKIKTGLLTQYYSSLSSSEIPYGGWIFNSEKVSIKKLCGFMNPGVFEKLIYSSNIQIHDEGYENSGIDNLVSLNTVILDLAPAIDEIFSGLKAKQRNKIRRAQKLGITIEEIPHSRMKEFYSLSIELKEKVGLRIRPVELYTRVLQEYSGDGNAICLVAKFKGEYISSMILIANKNVSIAWVAGRKVDLPNNLYQNELLWWESIVWAKNNGSKFLDLCGLDEKNRPHLARIKLSFSKEIVPIYGYSKKSSVFKAINKLQGAKQIV